MENFLCLGKAARVATCFSVAACALERAGMLDKTDLAKERLVMQEAKLAYARGKIDRALLILEPMDLNVGSVRQQWLSQRSAARGEAMRIKQYNFARRLLWATNWMVESGQCHGQPVVDRYRLALELQPGEKGHFALGQYMDFLLRSRSDEAQDEITHVIGTDEFARKYAVETLRCYAECLRVRVVRFCCTLNFHAIVDILIMTLSFYFLVHVYLHSMAQTIYFRACLDYSPYGSKYVH